MSSIQVDEYGLSESTIYRGDAIGLGVSSVLCYLPQRVIADPGANYENRWVSARSRVVPVMHLTPIAHRGECYFDVRSTCAHLFLLAPGFEQDGPDYWTPCLDGSWRLTSQGVSYYRFMIRSGKLILN